MTVFNQIISSIKSSKAGLFEVFQSKINTSNDDVIAYIKNAVSLLQSLGISQGDTVAVRCSEALDSIVWDLACMYIGAVSDHASPVAPSQFDININDCKAYISDKKTIQNDQALHFIQSSYYKIASDKHIQLSAPYDFRMCDPVTLKYTSGTSGDKKKYTAMFGHVKNQLSGIQELFDFNENDIMLVSMPTNIFLQRVLIYLSIIHGSRIAFCSPQNTIRYAKKIEPTFIMGPPYFFKSVQDLYYRKKDLGIRESFRSYWGKRIRCLWTGSAPISHSTLSFYEKNNLPIYEGYGTTETGMIAKNHPKACKVGTVGKVFPGVKIRIANNQELLVKVSHAPANVEWYKTGDIASIDSDGFISIQGRADDQLALSNGKKVNPIAIEKKIRSYQDVLQACIVGNSQPYLIAIIEANDKLIECKKHIEHAVAKINKYLDPGIRILKCHLVPAGSFMENGCITDQGKLKRSAITDTFEAQIELLYSDRG